jgi:site-specific recombinase XerD
MAKKDTIVIELERGVRQKCRPNGDVVYVVTVSFDGSRWQPEFTEPTIANAYKRRCDELKRQGIKPPGKEEYLRGFLSNTTAADSASTGLDEDLLVGALLLRVAERLETGTTEANLLIRFLKARKLQKRRSSALTLEDVVDLPKWLQREGYEHSSARQVIAFGRQAFTVAVASRLATHNHFVGMKAKRSGDTDRRGEERVRRKAGAFSGETLVAIAHVLRPVYLMAYWLVVLIGLRCSEAMGLQLGDWFEDLQTLKVTGQRRWSLVKGRSATKTPAGVRAIVVPLLLAKAITRYILQHHGTRPSEPEAAAAWDRRLLLVGAKGGPMDAASFRKGLKAAYRALGMTPEAIGRFRPVHHLRKVFSTILQRPKYRLSGAAISAVLGHEHPGRTDDDIADVTSRHYNVLEIDGMGRLAARVEKWVAKEIAPHLDSDDLLAVSELADPMTLQDAATLLSHGDHVEMVEGVLELIQDGTLRAAKFNFTCATDRQLVYVAGAGVAALLAERVRLSSTTYSASEVMDLLAVDRPVVYGAAASGEIVEHTTQATKRVHAPGRRGALPGGGRRFGKREVDELVIREADDIYKRRNWLSLRETAAILDRSTDSIRRMADRGELDSFRDPRSVLARRLINPECIAPVLADLEEVTFAEAAELLDRDVPFVTGLVKMEVLRRGMSLRTVRKIDVIRYLDRPA